MCLKNELSTMINNCATIILISAFFFPLGAIFLAGTVLNAELPNVELSNVELPNAENYPTSNNTERRILQKG
jgi:hypothetical protein